MPFPTTVFERIGPYREVWHLMRAWFKSGLGGNAKPAVATEVKEDFVLEALDTPRLYERLVVTVLLDGIRSAGLTLASVDSIPWPTHPVTSATDGCSRDPRRTGPTPASRSGTSPRSTRRGTPTATGWSFCAPPPGVFAPKGSSPEFRARNCRFRPTTRPTS